MAAEIRSSVPAKPTIDNASRDDLAIGDVVTVEVVPPATGTTFQWTLVFVPEGSTAVLTPAAAATTSGPLTFTVDVAGPYLVRLVVDAGLATESSQYVRLRALTPSLGLKLVAAGERRDSSGVIPVDVDTEGWANEQNENLRLLESAAKEHNYHIKMVGGEDPVIQTGPNRKAWQADNTLFYHGWCTTDTTLLGVTVFMETPNTQGNYFLEVFNVSAALSALAAPFDMNTLAVGTVTDVPISGIGAALQFGAKDVWRIQLTSNDAGFDGEQVYVNLRFGVS